MKTRRTTGLENLPTPTPVPKPAMTPTSVSESGKVTQEYIDELESWAPVLASRLKAELEKGTLYLDQRTFDLPLAGSV